MYILYKGRVRIVFGDESKGEFVEREASTFFGETGLQTISRRNATIYALADWETLILYKNDYDKAIKDAEKLQKLENFKYLKSMDYFKPWNYEDLSQFNDKLSSIVYKPNDIVYKQGDAPTQFYIVSKGVLYMETILDIDMFYKYPQGKNKWMTTQMTRRVRYKVKELKEGDFFGYDELISNSKRKTTVYSLHESRVYYMNAVLFRNFFTSEKVEKLNKMFPSLDFNHIGQIIISNLEMKKKYSNSFLSALQVNYVPDSWRDSFYGDVKMKKLRPWLNRAKHIQLGKSKFYILDNVEKHETLKITYKYYEVDRDAVLTPKVHLAGINESKKEEQ
jgi:CRP-like cAMP-binding protein